MTVASAISVSKAFSRTVKLLYGKAVPSWRLSCSPNVDVNHPVIRFGLGSTDMYGIGWRGPNVTANNKVWQHPSQPAGRQSLCLQLCVCFVRGKRIYALFRGLLCIYIYIYTGRNVYASFSVFPTRYFFLFFFSALPTRRRTFYFRWSRRFSPVPYITV